MKKETDKYIAGPLEYDRLLCSYTFQKEYREMKGIGQSTVSNENDQCDKATRVHSNIEKYKEFSEERAKKLYGTVGSVYKKWP
jgi:hypothetical protein